MHVPGKEKYLCFLVSAVGATGYLYLYLKESMHQNIGVHEIKVVC